MPKSQGQIITGVREEKPTLQQLMLPTRGWGSVYTYPSRPTAYKELTVAIRTMFSVRAVSLSPLIYSDSQVLGCPYTISL